jgi:hypothetical protein
VGDLPVGETVSVLFNPDKPDQAFAEPRGGSVTYLVISMALLAAVAACAVIAATASDRPAGPRRGLQAPGVGAVGGVVDDRVGGGADGQPRLGFRRWPG